MIFPKEITSLVVIWSRFDPVHPALPPNSMLGTPTPTPWQHLTTSSAIERCHQHPILRHLQRQPKRHLLQHLPAASAIRYHQRHPRPHPWLNLPTSSAIKHCYQHPIRHLQGHPRWHPENKQTCATPRSWRRLQGVVCYKPAHQVSLPKQTSNRRPSVLRLHLLSGHLHRIRIISLGLPFPLKCAFMGSCLSVRGGCFLSDRNDFEMHPSLTMLLQQWPLQRTQVNKTEYKRHSPGWNSQLRLELWIHSQESWEATKTSGAKRLQCSSIKRSWKLQQWPSPPTVTFIMSFIFLSSCQRSHVFFPVLSLQILNKFAVELNGDSQRRQFLFRVWLDKY